MISATISAGSKPSKPMASRAPSRLVLRRSAAIASPTPGYCTLTATARSRPSFGIAPHGAVHLADRRRRDRIGIPLDEQLLGRRAELGLHHRRRQCGAHRRGVGLQLGEGQAHRLGQSVVDIARHLAELHQRALHVAEPLGDLLGAAQLALGVELDAAFGAGEHLPRGGRRVRRPDAEPEARQLDVARRATGLRDRARPAGAPPPAREGHDDGDERSCRERHPAPASRHAITSRRRIDGRARAGRSPS